MVSNAGPMHGIERLVLLSTQLATVFGRQYGNILKITGNAKRHTNQEVKKRSLPAVFAVPIRSGHSLRTLTFVLWIYTEIGMMRSKVKHYWRVATTGIGFTVFGIGTLMLSMFFLVVVRWLPVSNQKKKHWVQSSIRNLTRFFILNMKWLGLSDHSYIHAERLKTRGKVIVANHPSLVDALYLMAKTENLCCIVKEDLWHNPFTSYIVRMAEYIPNHSATVTEDAAEAVRNGKNLLVFPEGTRTRSNEALSLRRGAAHIALAADCDVLPVVIDVSPPTLRKGEPWYEVPERKFQVTIDIFEPVSARQCGVDLTKPVTIQARQLNRYLIEFYQEQLKDTRTTPNVIQGVANAFHGQTRERQAG